MASHSLYPALAPSQDQASQSLGTFTTVPELGTIAAKGSKTVTLKLEAARLGRIQLPVYVRVAGSRNKPIQLVADAKAMGPWLEFAVMPAPTAAAAALSGQLAADSLVSESGGGVVADASADATAVMGSTAGGSGGTLDGGSSSMSGLLVAEASSTSQLTSVSGAKRRTGRKGKGPKEPTPRWAAAASIAFDKVQVLQPHTQQLLLRNPSLIDSEVKLFVEGRDSVFEVRWLVRRWCWQRCLSQKHLKLNSSAVAVIQQTCHPSVVGLHMHVFCALCRLSRASWWCQLVGRRLCLCGCCWTMRRPSRTRCMCLCLRALT